MRSFLLFFCVFFVVACGDTVHNHYYVINDGEIIPCPDNDCEGIFHPDDDTKEKVDNDLEQAESDQELTDESTDSENDSDSVVVQDDKETNDIDDLFDYCSPVLDAKSEEINGNYAQAPDGTTTVLNIETESLVEEKTCQITFIAPSISALNGLKIKATSLPIKMMVVENKSQEYYFFASFFSGSNYLRLELYTKENEELVLDDQFKKK